MECRHQPSGLRQASPIHAYMGHPQVMHAMQTSTTHLLPRQYWLLFRAPYMARDSIQASGRDYRTSDTGAKQAIKLGLGSP